MLGSLCHTQGTHGVGWGWGPVAERLAILSPLVAHFLCVSAILCRSAARSPVDILRRHQERSQARTNQEIISVLRLSSRTFKVSLTRLFCRPAERLPSQGSPYSSGSGRR